MFKTKHISFILILVGLVTFCYSLGLKPYTNAKEYSEKYNQLSDAQDSDAFFMLRESYLTPKYALEDYSFTAFILAVSVWFFFQQGRNFRTPSRKITIVLVGLIAVISTTIAFVGDLFLEMSRDAFPYWADSIVIPLMAVPNIFMVLFIWYVFQLTGLVGSFRTDVTIHKPKFNIPVVLYGIQLVTMLVFTVIFSIEGSFWYLGASILWCSFFAFLMLGRSSISVSPIPKQTKNHFF